MEHGRWYYLYSSLKMSFQGIVALYYNAYRFYELLLFGFPMRSCAEKIGSVTNAEKVGVPLRVGWQ